MFINSIYQRKNELQQTMDKLREQLKEFPEGELFCVKNGKYVKWYRCNHSNPIYIPKSERKTAQILAAKKYKTHFLYECEQEFRIVMNAHYILGNKLYIPILQY